MADRFDKFTERARRVLTHAQEEALRFNHNYIGTEHLLLGLVRERDGVAAAVLTNLGVGLSKVRSAVEFIIGRGEKSITGEIGLTPRAKKVIELAVEEARRLDHSHIGTEHLLLGLVREGEAITFGVLESLGVSLERLRAETARVLAEGPRRPGHRWGIWAADEAHLEAAKARVREARTAVLSLEGEPLEMVLLAELLVPRLDFILEALHQWAGIADPAAARAAVKETLGATSRITLAVAASGHASAAVALTNMVIAVERALAE